VTFARSPAQHDRLVGELHEARTFGFGPDDLRWLDGGELADIGRPPGTRAAVFTPHCAAVHPARLVHAIARTVVDRGVALHDRTPVEADRRTGSRLRAAR
jgi:glycine/D-amino acid oxidase-like deaminating enzyme